MFSLWRGAGATFSLVGALYLAGCGGGGSGPTPSPTSTPRPGTTATPTRTPASSNTIIVRLRDSSGLAVDGVVTLTVGANTFRLGTTAGQASFVGFVAGTYSVSAQVNGRTQAQSFNAINGTTTVNLVFASGITPTPAGTIPTPPF